jgi:hypothetical protein
VPSPTDHRKLRMAMLDFGGKGSNPAKVGLLWCKYFIHGLGLPIAIIHESSKGASPINPFWSRVLGARCRTTNFHEEDARLHGSVAFLLELHPGSGIIRRG